MRTQVWQIEHGCCGIVQHVTTTELGEEAGGRLGMIDSGTSVDFRTRW